MAPFAESPLRPSAPKLALTDSPHTAERRTRRLRTCLAVLALAGAGWGCAPERFEMVAIENRCSLRLDGRDDFVDLGQVAAGDPLLLAGSRFTVAAWFRQEAGGDAYERILDKSDGALAHDGWALAVDPGERRIHFYVHDGRRGGDFISRAGAFQRDQWHLVVAVARASRLEIYLDGRRDRSAVYESGAFALPAAHATGARLGAWNHEPGRAFRGWIDEVAIWKTDLPAVAIGSLAEARGRTDLRRDSAAYAASGDLVAWWRMEADPEGGSAATIRDLVSSLTGRLMPDPAGGNAPHIDCGTIP